MGPEVIELEEKLCNYVGVKYCISCSSGTDALLIPLMAKGIGIGDAVITTPFTYIATAEVISLVGATPVFVDIYDSTYNMDPSYIEDAIQYAENKGLNTKAIIPVDLFGLPARYRIISEIAEKYNSGFIAVIDNDGEFLTKLLKLKPYYKENKTIDLFYDNENLQIYKILLNKG